MIKIIKKIVNTNIKQETEYINQFLAEYTSFPEYIEKKLSSYSGFDAVLDEHNNIKMKYDEVIDLINAVAKSMQSQNIQKGDFVSFFSENHGKHFVFNQGIMKAGAISVLRGTGAPEEELEFILNHGECKALVVSDYKFLTKIKNILNKNEYLKFIVTIFAVGKKPTDIKFPIYSAEEFIDLGKNHEFIAPKLSLEDTAEMLYTSGTTSFPKGVMLSHKNLLSQMPTISQGLGIKQQEKSLQILPIWHSYESTTQALFFATGFYLHFTTLPNLKNDMQKYDIDIFMSVPRIWEALRLGIYQKLKQRSKFIYYCFDFAIKTSITYKLHKMYSEQRTINNRDGYNIFAMIYHTVTRSFIKPLHIFFTKTLYKEIKNNAGLNFRASFSGGGALSLKDELFYDAMGVNLRTGYGLTETSPDVTLRHARDKNYLCSVGKPIIGTEIKIINPETQEEVGIFEQGLVLIRGPQIMKGYYKDKEATEKAIDKEGWFNSGDLGMLTDTNHLILVGRIKETIVLSSGENVEPVPIEDAVSESRFIEQIVLVGQDESSIGALIVPSEEALLKCGLALNNLRQGSNSNLLIKNPDLQELIKKEINSYIKHKPNLKPFEQIKKFAILNNPFDKENGLLSQTGKTKRNNIFTYYKEIISKMFSDK